MLDGRVFPVWLVGVILVAGGVALIAFAPPSSLTGAATAILLGCGIGVLGLARILELIFLFEAQKT